MKTNNMDQQSPAWLLESAVDEVVFSSEFLQSFPMKSVNGRFFTPDGRIDDENQLRKMIYDLLKPYISTNLTKRVSSLVEVLRMECCTENLPLHMDRIHVANGTLFLDGTFTEKKEFCQNRLPVFYDPAAPVPERWMKFMEELLEETDILTLQEYLGYSLIPTTRAQKMMMILGNGGEGKSRIGLVMGKMLGPALVMDSLHKIETNRFARADLENKLMMVDDDTDTNALPKTNNIKTIITAEGPIDLERKGQQSYQGKLYTRFLCFGNGELTAANDRSNGFYRRQMVLYAKAPAPDRVDDPYLADKLFQELPGIFNWCFEGLLRLLKNNFQFTVSQHMLDNMREIQANTDSITAFLESSGYISFETDAMSSSKDIYKVYQQFCADNLYCPAASSTLSSVLKNQKAKYRVEPTSNIYLPAANSSVKKRVRGFKGIRLLDQTD